MTCCNTLYCYQVYVATPSPARDMTASYTAWAHSTIVSPWGEVVTRAGEAEEIVTADIDLEYLASVRSQVPITLQRREDLYKVVRQDVISNTTVQWWGYNFSHLEQCISTSVCIFISRNDEHCTTFSGSHGMLCSLYF